MVKYINVLSCKYVFAPPNILQIGPEAERQILECRLATASLLIVVVVTITYFSISLSPTKISLGKDHWSGPVGVKCLLLWQP